MTPGRDRHGLTPKQAKAVQHYALHGDMSAAYRHAYNAGGMNLNSVNRAAFRLFESPAVAARVEQLRAQVDAKAELTLQEAHTILAKIARRDDIPAIVVRAIEREARMRGWDKQATLGDGQIVINLNMGEKDE